MVTEDNSPWLVTTDTGVVLNIVVVPHATRSRVTGLEGGGLRVNLDSTSFDGKANERLVRFLADTLEVSTAQINVVAGAANKSKRVEIEAIHTAQVLMRLGPSTGLEKP